MNSATPLPAGPVRFGILGTGSIAAEVADAIALSQLCVAHRVASRESRRAADFAARHGVGAHCDSYRDLLDDPEVEIVYVASPHPQHAGLAGAALMAGKHVLCEKPLTVNAGEASELVALARSRGLLLLEAFAYWFHPQTAALVDLVRGGAIGAVRAIDVTFSYSVGEAYEGRATANALAGGGILDVGCYCTSMAQTIVAAASAVPAPEPLEVAGLAALDAVERTDSYAAAVMLYPGEILAQLACGVTLTQDDHVRVYGTGGQLHIPHPCWLDGRRDAASTIELRGADGAARSVAIPGGQNIFTLEAEAAARMLREDPRACDPYLEDSLANMRTLDRWRAAAGVRYDLEQARP